jgi:cytochrome b561
VWQVDTSATSLYLAAAPPLGQSVAHVHTILGNVIIWLGGLHAAAALFHHYFMRDCVWAGIAFPGRSAENSHLPARDLQCCTA